MGKSDSDGLSVRAVTRLTGVSEHLLRAWERRYRIVVPHRSPGGTRRYSDRDVERLRQVKRAVDAGYAIRAVAQMSPAELAAIGDAQNAESPVPNVVQLLLDCVDRGDWQSFERELGRLVEWLGPTRWAIDVVAPFSAEVGRRWRAGDFGIDQEHCATAIVERAIALEQSQARPVSGLPRLVLTTPPKELHAVGVQLAALIAQSRGFPTAMLGPQTPHDALASFLERGGDAVVVIGVTKLSRAATIEYLTALRQAVDARTPILVGGAAAQRLEPPAGVTKLTSFAEFVDALTAIERRVGGTRVETVRTVNRGEPDRPS